jgi:hypothetical protein
MSITNDFNLIFTFCSYYNTEKRAISASEVEAQIMKSAQKRVVAYLQALLDYKGLADHYAVTNSVGMPSMPRVPWISIIRKKQKVYSYPSVTICFGRAGNGFVLGLMKSAGTNKFEFDTVKRVNKQNFIDVDSNRESTSYNNKFVNPSEFYKGEINIVELERKIVESLELEKNHMALKFSRSAMYES